MAASLVPCAHCGCHAKAVEITCPHCGQKLRDEGGKLPRAAASVVLGLTAAAATVLLSACYGPGQTGGAGGMGGSGGFGGEAGTGGSVGGGGTDGG